MGSDLIPYAYKTFYILVTTIGMLGNALIIYATILSRRMMCIVVAPLQGLVYDVFSKTIMAVNIAILIIYALFIVLVKKWNVADGSMKSIYRSLIIISLTVVFGWSSTMLIVIAADAMHLSIDRYIINLLAGVFVTMATACNFFVYYTSRVSQRVRSNPPLKGIEEKTLAFVYNTKLCETNRLDILCCIEYEECT
ncbi:hypothetical protein ANCCEY_04971 [Ancylostoma ceylanicum]|uniref:G-protein coupled receptors family 1 profile domain-containing protein n=1 Tax=Ancylostoma ceylanicum TaxID=53326 RepID=A0A0D6LXM7_9BILA|nr:hypothetical protein ANCCEY_04971 [Ancylostoma ceylanicum]